MSEAASSIMVYSWLWGSQTAVKKSVIYQRSTLNKIFSVILGVSYLVNRIGLFLWRRFCKFDRVCWSLMWIENDECMFSPALQGSRWKVSAVAKAKVTVWWLGEVDLYLFLFSRSVITLYAGLQKLIFCF